MPFYLLFSHLKSLFNQSQFRSRSLFLKTLARFFCAFQALLYLFLDRETKTACSNQEVNAQQNDYFVFCVFPSNFWQSICSFEVLCPPPAFFRVTDSHSKLSSLSGERWFKAHLQRRTAGFIFSHVHYFALIGTECMLPFYRNATQYCEILPHFLSRFFFYPE